MGSEQRITCGLRCNTALHCKILCLRGWQSPAGAGGRARPSTPSGAGEPGEDAEPASSTPAPLRCAPQRASVAVGVASPDRGKRLTLSFYLYSLVPSSSKGSAKPGDARTADVH